MQRAAEKSNLVGTYVILAPVPEGQDVPVPPRLAECVPPVSLARSGVGFAELKHFHALQPGGALPTAVLLRVISAQLPASVPALISPQNTLPVLINWELF